LEISIKPEQEVTIVAVSGSVDGLTADGLLAALSGEVGRGHARLVVDCAALDYTSSAGLRALLGSVKQARAQGGDVRLAAVQGPVMRVLELSGFTSILKSFPDVSSAVASYSAAGAM